MAYAYTPQRTDSTASTPLTPLGSARSHQRTDSASDVDTELPETPDKPSNAVLDDPRGLPPLKVINFWWPEFLSYTAAAVTLLIIIIVVVIHQDRPLSKWPHFISINALLSIFLSIFHALVLFPVVQGKI